MTGYRFERLSENTLSDLKLLYKDAFHTDVSLEFLNMKYDTSFTGIKYLGYIAYDVNDKPAAYYGVFPLYAMYHGETILAAQSGDTMTHSMHRGKGLFYNLAGQAYKLAAELGIKFVYGFPNKHNSYHGLMKLKWTHNGDMKSYRIFVPSIPLSIAADKISSLEKQYLKRAEKKLRNYAVKSRSFPNSIPDDEYIVVKRDDAYFEYKKYFKKYIIETAGKNIWVKPARTLQTGDVEKCSADEFFTIIRRLKEIAFKIGTPAVTFQVSPGTAYDKLLSRKHKAENSLPICYLDLASGLDLSKLRFSMADFDTF